MDEGVRLSSVYAVVMRQRLVCLPVQCVSPGCLLVSQELSKQITEREQANRQLQALFEQSKAELTKLKERLASQEATHNEARKQLQREPRLLALF
jgi:septal ring factor EnvC (AmiA/AmiB activator)